MKKFPKIFLSAALATSLCLPSLGKLAVTTTPVEAATTKTYFSTTPTGYDSADDVKYVTSGGYTVNWGAREETCTFLSSRATAFYTGNNTFEVLSQKSGGSTQSNAPQSALYSSLKSFMTSKHSYINGYSANNNLLKYTDCVSSNYSNISSFYSGTVLSGTWDSAKTWNKEHTWPNSKGLEGSDEDDIMMIRPTSVSENSNRGNTAYGESSSYYDPNGLGANVRGDCARIVLYTYTRWGNTSYMWGKSGVMESLEILLKWMEEDPVDTWEMGRNDAVQSITGTRNVFVDYPEFAWLLFGKSAPTDMPTPSGIANGGTITGGGNGDSTTPDDGEDDNGGTTTPTTPTTTYTSIATLHASATGTSATAKGVVTAVGKAGFMFNDGTGSMYFFTNNTLPTVKVGDEVEVSGSLSEFYGSKQFSSKDGATYSKKDVDVPAYVKPTPTVWDGDDVDAYTGTVGEYVKITADVYTKEKYVNCTVTGATKNKLSLIVPTDDVLGSIKLSSTAQTLVIKGYTCYLSQDKSGNTYAYLIVTSICLPDEDVEDEQPTNPDDNQGNENQGGNTGDTPTNPDTPVNPEGGNGDNTGNENQGGENVTDPPCELPEENTDLTPEPQVPNDLLSGMNCSGSITGGLTVLSVALGAVALLLKKKED